VAVAEAVAERGDELRLWVVLTEEVGDRVVQRRVEARGEAAFGIVDLEGVVAVAERLSQFGLDGLLRVAGEDRAVECRRGLFGHDVLRPARVEHGRRRDVLHQRAHDPVESGMRRARLRDAFLVARRFGCQVP